MNKLEFHDNESTDEISVFGDECQNGKLYKSPLVSPSKESLS